MKTWNTYVQGFMKTHRWSVFVSLIAGIVIVSFSILYFAQNRLLYYPHFDMEAQAILSNLEQDEYEEITIQLDDSSCRGWGYRVSDTNSTILYFGGNAQTSADFFVTLNNKYKQNYNWVMIDYPGYGTSSGRPEYKKILQAADKAYQFVAESSFYGGNEIFIAGFSLGTGVATYVAAKYEVDKLILTAPYDKGVSLYNSVINIFCQDRFRMKY